VNAAVASSRRLTAAETAAAVEHLTALYAAVRAAIEGFAAVMTTTADLGVLASLNQKYVTRACWQRYDALREVAAEPEKLPLPDLTAANTAAPRLFVPVPPESIGEDGSAVEAIGADPAVAAVVLHWLPLAGGPEQTVALTRKGRGVWTGTLAADGPGRYWGTARDGANREQARRPVAPATAGAIPLGGSD